MIPSWKAKKEITEYCRALYEKNLITSTDGNVSIRLNESRVLITPSGINKGFLKEDDLVVIDLKGHQISGRRKPSTEKAAHVFIYNERPNVHAIVHAHPPTCVALSISGHEFKAEALPEVILSLGKIPTVPYTTPSSSELCVQLSRYIHSHDALILSHHGSITVGSTISDAFNKLERLEHAAHILWKAYQIGEVIPLSHDEVSKLTQHGQNLGFLPY